MENSPLNYLTHDLSSHMYDNYVKERRFLKIMLNDQLKYFTNPDIYPEFYGMDSAPTYIKKDDHIRKNLWENFNKDKHELLVNNKLLLTFLRKHYTLKIKDKKIIHQMRS